MQAVYILYTPHGRFVFMKSYFAATFSEQSYSSGG